MRRIGNAVMQGALCQLMPAGVWAVQHCSQLGIGAAWSGRTTFLLGAVLTVCSSRTHPGAAQVL